jgi:riboflavin synthase alpha subunit
MVTVKGFSLTVWVIFISDFGVILIPVCRYECTVRSL